MNFKKLKNDETKYMKPKSSNVLNLSKYKRRNKYMKFKTTT